MKLVIHDLKKEEWDRISERYPDSHVVSDNGTILPCVGCFGCWNKDPGRCVMKDGYQDMGELIHKSDEVIVISRYSYGGFSGFVKNVFDRCLAYVLPHFEIVDGESHHKKRYDEDKPYTFIFYGHDLSEKEKEDARRYVKAVTVNMRTHVKDVVFEEAEEIITKTKEDEKCGGPVVLLNASMRTANGNSAKLLKELRKQIKGETETLDLAKYLKDLPGLVKKLEEASAIVIGTPLYVDGLPSQLIRMFETFEKEYDKGSKRIYVLANMGLYESGQLINLLTAVRNWGETMRFEYGGALAVSAGELVGGLLEMTSIDSWPLKPIGGKMKQFALAIDEGRTTDDLYVGPRFPRFLYVAIANSGWKRMAKANGIEEKDLYRRIG